MRWILILLLMVFIGLQYRLWIGPGSWAEITSLEAQIEQQQSENQRLQNRNAVLEQDVFDLKNGLQAVEERARTELGLIKQGETFYLLVEEKKP